MIKNQFGITCYIELSSMLYLCLIPLCKIFKIEVKVNDIDLIKELDEEYKNIESLKDKVSKTNLLEFYNHK